MYICEPECVNKVIITKAGGSVPINRTKLTDDYICFLLIGFVRRDVYKMKVLLQIC